MTEQGTNVTPGGPNDWLGRIAYENYCRLREWKSFTGQPLPAWNGNGGVGVEAGIKTAWIASALAVAGTCVTPIHTAVAVNVPRHVFHCKKWRAAIDGIIQEIKKEEFTATSSEEQGRRSRERSLVITKLQEGVMWLGMDLKALNEPNPYPASKDPTSSVIAPTADGLKL